MNAEAPAANLSDEYPSNTVTDNFTVHLHIVVDNDRWHPVLSVWLGATLHQQPPTHHGQRFVTIIFFFFAVDTRTTPRTKTPNTPWSTFVRQCAIHIFVTVHHHIVVEQIFIIVTGCIVIFFLLIPVPRTAAIVAVVIIYNVHTTAHVDGV